MLRPNIYILLWNSKNNGFYHLYIC